MINFVSYFFRCCFFLLFKIFPDDLFFSLFAAFCFSWGHRKDVVWKASTSTLFMGLMFAIIVASALMMMSVVVCWLVTRDSLTNWTCSLADREEKRAHPRPVNRPQVFLFLYLCEMMCRLYSFIRRKLLFWCLCASSLHLLQSITWTKRKSCSKRVYEKHDNFTAARFSLVPSLSLVEYVSLALRCLTPKGPTTVKQCCKRGEGKVLR